MLSQAQRTTILELNTQQVSKRNIARVLGISRVAVRTVLRGRAAGMARAAPWRQGSCWEAASDPGRRPRSSDCGGAAGAASACLDFELFHGIQAGDDVLASVEKAAPVSTQAK